MVPDRGERTRRQERMARAALLVVLYATPALICVRGAYVADVDLGWHLRTAEWIVEHRAFPHTDPFSIGGMGKPWEAYSWVFELVLLRLYRWCGLVGVVGYSAGMVLAITVAVHRLMARLEADVTKAVLLTMAAMICMSSLYTPRPWLFTILFFAIEMKVLVEARTSGRMRGLLWLPVLFAVWANIHIQFVDGLVVLGVAAFEALAERWRPTGSTRLSAAGVGAVLGACALAVLANPYGWRVYTVAYELASQNGVLKTVTEMQAIPFRAFHDFLLLFMALAAAATLGWRRQRPGLLPVWETGLLALAAVVSFRSQRDVWLMAIVAAVVLAGASEQEHQPRTAEPEVAAPVVALAACVVVLAGAALMKVSNARLAESLAAQMPVRAVEVVKARGYKGAIYNTYDWGGYLIWALREPVSIDGRAALQGDTGIERSMATWFAEPGWGTDPSFVSAGVVIAPVKLPLAQLLRLDARFAVVYEDKVAVVFVRRG